MSTYIVNQAGGKGGKDYYGMTPINSGSTITIRSGQYVDSITINDTRLGGPKGEDDATLALESNEWVVRVEVRSGDYIDYIKFITNKGRTISGGTDNKGVQEEFNGKQLIALSGKGGQFIDSLSFLFEK